MSHIVSEFDDSEGQHSLMSDGSFSVEEQDLMLDDSAIEEDETSSVHIPIGFDDEENVFQTTLSDAELLKKVNDSFLDMKNWFKMAARASDEEFFSFFKENFEICQTITAKAILFGENDNSGGCLDRKKQEYVFFFLLCTYHNIDDFADLTQKFILK